MKTDRELLELAARAAGLKIDKSPYNGGGQGNTGFDVMGNVVLDWHNSALWNPLVHDGDNARLETSLNIDILSGPDRVSAISSDVVTHEAYGDHKGDKQKARRRASTRAAAAIGEQMP